MRTVHLHGRLAEDFGPRFELNVNSVAEAARALEANFPGRFFRTIRSGAFQLFRGPDPEEGEAIDASMLGMRFGRGDFHIVPVVAGAGGNTKGIVTVVVGVALIAVATAGAGALLGGQAAAAGGFGATAFKVLGSSVTFGNIALFGAAIALQGVSSLLTPTPQALELGSTASSARNEPSFFFDGAVNVVSQGGPVPLVYGRVRTGSTVISSGISAEQI